MNKYRNVRTVVDNIKFDSKAEANRYLELKLLVKARKITNLELQPTFILQKSYVYFGKTVRAITYKGDFAYVDVYTGQEIVEDVKGVETAVFKLKAKMFRKLYPGKKLILVK